MSERRLHLKKLVVLFGLIGSGKSYLARNWADSRGFSYHNTDIIRKELAGQKAGDFRSAGFGAQIYSAAMSRLTYNRLIDRARGDLGQPSKQVVVLDGSFGDPMQRQRLVSELVELAEVYFVYCFCSDRCRWGRLEERAKNPMAVSDGRWEIYQEQKQRFGKPEAIDGIGLLKLDTDRPLVELCGSLDVFIGLDEPK